MYLEILKHDGPARHGKLFLEGKSIKTPSLFWNLAAGLAHSSFFTLSAPGKGVKDGGLVSYGTIFSENRIERFGILPSFPSGYNVPEEIAEIAVEKTLNFAGGYPGFGAIVEGGRYVNLRMMCAENFKDRPILKIADSDKLIRNHRRLVDILTALRESISPNTALYMSEVPAHFFPILAYMGVDMFDIKRAVLGSHEDIYYLPTGQFQLEMLSELPCPCSVCKKASPEELGNRGLMTHNINVFIASIREVREAIRVGRMRNLVEERAACDANIMGALRILDIERQDFLERYTPIYPTSIHQRSFGVKRGRSS